MYFMLGNHRLHFKKIIQETENNILQAEPTEKNVTEKEVTSEAFNEVLQEEEPKAEDSGEKYEGEFEKFLEQFPEADAKTVVKGAVKNGDFSKGCFTRQYVRALREEIEALKEENASEEAVTKKALASGKVTEAIVKEYLKAIIHSQAQMRNLPKGNAPVLPPSKPKTITEAGVLAGDIYKNKNK